jgi:hypothetical protein
MFTVHVEEPASAELSSGLDELVAEGARRMLAAALEAEVDRHISSLIHEVDEDGHRLVVRNGHAEPRSLVTGAGPIEVRAHGSMTAGSTTRPGNACGFALRSCHLGPASEGLDLADHATKAGLELVRLVDLRGS